MLVAVAILSSTVVRSLAAGQAVREIRDVSAEFHEHCGRGERIGIRLRDASTIRGTLTDCQADRLQIAAEPTNKARLVRYSHVAALLDPDTGAVTATVVAPSRKGLNRDGKILVGIGIGLAVFVIWASLGGAFAG